MMRLGEGLVCSRLSVSSSQAPVRVFAIGSPKPREILESSQEARNSTKSGLSKVLQG
jgi:hypothetical protein